MSFNQNSQFLSKNLVNEILREADTSNRIPELGIQEAKYKNYEEKESSETSTRLSDGFRSEEEKELDEIRHTPKKRVQRLRNLEVSNKSPLTLSPEDSTKNGGRRLNRWQQSQQDKEVDYKAERVRLINETPVDFAAQKIVNLNVGENSQAVIPLPEKKSIRVMKTAWNPSSVDSNTLEQFLLEVETVLGLIDQQKCLKLLAEKNGNIEETLNLIKCEKKKYYNQFSIKSVTKKFFI